MWPVLCANALGDAYFGEVSKCVSGRKLARRNTHVSITEGHFSVQCRTPGHQRESVGILAGRLPRALPKIRS